MLFRVSAAAIAALTMSGVAQAQPNAVGAIEIDKRTIDISGNGYRRTIPCEGRDVIVAGSDHVITLTGVCASLDVSGNNNVVSAAIAPGGKLAVTGSDHKVRWRSSGELRQDLSGIGNEVSRQTGR